MTAVVGLILGVGVAAAFGDPGNGNGGPGAPQGNANGQTNGNGGGNGNASTHATQGTGGTFGDPTQPQPVNHPDNQNGANAHPGPYSSTRDGSPSLNGNGNGNAVGKPCAGCVGKADNKNPLGQFPNGSDANNGYECDGNNGIGKTNPAHTGCAERPVVPETPPVPVTPPGEIPPTQPGPPPKVPVLVSASSVSIPGVSIPTVSIPTVGIPTVGRPSLPVTGSSVLVPLAIALAALALGGIMTALGRRRVTGT